MKKIKRWFVNKAPLWAAASLKADNAKLMEEIHRLRAENERLNAYIQGMQYATRALKRITIQTGGDPS